MHRITSIESIHVRYVMVNHKPHRKQGCITKRQYCQSQVIYKCVLHSELFWRNETIHLKVYRKHPKILMEANRERNVFPHDNATPHTFLLSRGKSLGLGWEVKPYLPYSLKLILSGYHSFQSLWNCMNFKTSKMIYDII